MKKHRINPCLVIMQPTFLPWAGYFNLLAQADDFVFLDDVQLEKQSWQTRNRLLVGGKVHWITIPVHHKKLAQTIAETEVINTGRWRDKLIRKFTQNYGRHPNYDSAREIIDTLLSLTARNLAELNESVIRFVAERLDLQPRFHRASTIRDSAGIRSERLIVLCRIFGAREYLSPVGSSAYLMNDGFSDRSPAQLRFQDYVPQPYTQQGSTTFVSHLSIIDVVANLGWSATRRYAIKGIP